MLVLGVGSDDTKAHQRVLELETGH